MTVSITQTQWNIRELPDVYYPWWVIAFLKIIERFIEFLYFLDREINNILLNFYFFILFL